MENSLSAVSRRSADRVEVGVDQIERHSTPWRV
jgi:hypothetical protein